MVEGGAISSTLGYFPSWLTITISFAIPSPCNCSCLPSRPPPKSFVASTSHLGGLLDLVVHVVCLWAWERVSWESKLHNLCARRVRYFFCGRACCSCMWILLGSKAATLVLALVPPYEAFCCFCMHVLLCSKVLSMTIEESCCCVHVSLVQKFLESMWVFLLL